MSSIYGGTNVSVTELLMRVTFHEALMSKKRKLYLSVNVLSMKVRIEDTIFYVSYWRGDRHFTWSSKPQEGLPICRANKGSTFISQLV